MILGANGVKMSKSLGNVVDPNDVVDKFGADTLRTYVLFMGDYGSAAPWNDNSVRGCKRFLDRVASLTDIASGRGETPELSSAFHKTVKKVTEDIEAMKFNTAIAAMMTLLNDICDHGSLTLDELSVFIRILSPFAPHVCEELWAAIGGEGFASVAPWPEYDESQTVDDTVEIAVQVCGKLRGTVTIPVSATSEEAIAAAKADARVAANLEGKTVIKEIYVPGKLVNIVAK